MKRLKQLTVLTALVSTNFILAQSGDLKSGIDDATEQVLEIVQPVKLFLYAIAAVIGVFGALRVYSKFQNQDNDVYKAAGTYGFAFIFLIAAGFIIDSLFTN